MIGMLISAYSIGILISLPPGAITVATVQRTFSGGLRNALIFNAGIVIGDILYLLLVYLGLHVLLEGNEPLRLALFLLSGGWIGWLGCGAVRQHIQLEPLRGAAHRTAPWRSFQAGLVMNLLNPLTLAGWTALAGHFFNTWRLHWPPIMPYGLFAIGLMLVGVISWQCMLILLTNTMRKRMSPLFLRTLSIGGGVLLILYGVGAWIAALELSMRMR